jgi:hypothetical protein
VIEEAVAQTRTAHLAALTTAREQHAAATEALSAKHAAQLGARDTQHAEARARVAESHRKAIADLASQVDRSLAALVDEHRATLAEAERARQADREKLVAEHEAALEARRAAADAAQAAGLAALDRLRAELEAKHGVAIADAVAAARRETTAEQTKTISELTGTHGAAVTTLAGEHERDLANVKGEVARLEAALAEAQRSHVAALAELRKSHAEAIVEQTIKHDSQLAELDAHRIAAQTSTAESGRQTIADLEARLDRATRPLDAELAAAQRQLVEQAEHHRRALGELEQRLRSEHTNELVAVREQHRVVADAAEARLVAAGADPRPADDVTIREQIAATERAAATVVARELLRAMLRAQFSGGAPPDVAAIRVPERLAERVIKPPAPVANPSTPPPIPKRDAGGKRTGFERHKLEAIAAPASPALAAMPSMISLPDPAPAKPVWQQRRVVIAGTALVAIIPIAILATAGGDDPTRATAATNANTAKTTIHASPPPVSEAKAPEPIAPPPQDCTFFVAANVNNAEVWIDKIRRGTTNNTVTHPCGDASITIRHPAFNEQARLVKLVPKGRYAFVLAKKR